ncbi:isochorismate synthase [Aureitalea marina]|uniref:isochorismate synthase n=1 Tax=Aureitalea marina TaxID=930804 RepID=A0A2S7KNK6_9FLAO|nr:isochorismate synthase [Aureitalea marina]PQB04202.1 hypothetical protein BST85_04255 [Aureitalea marina]
MRNVEELIARTDCSLEHSRPFVIYSEVGSKTIQAYFSEDNPSEIEPFSGRGFVFAPYQYDNNALFLNFDNSSSLHLEHTEWSQELTSLSGENRPCTESEMSSYLRLVKDALSLIKVKTVKKVVTSRCSSIALRDFDLNSLFRRLFGLYPDAFCYIWYHPESGLWCGATPELLVQTDGQEFHTMALAGTKPYEQYLPANWSEKEEEEQQLVVDFIVNRLQKVTSVVKLSKTRTHRAGQVVHLRTDISGMLKKNKTTLGSLVRTLHPTSAVCGMPRKLSSNFLEKQEGYDREYYTGFLGPYNQEESMGKLYVNLRCMKLFKDKAHIYVGGGITEQSDPQSEWEETENKKRTMLEVLSAML